MDAARYYISMTDHPDAIMTAIDMTAIGCIKEISKSKYKIPQDISIIGFDNVSLSNLVAPALTTIAQPIRKMGQTAAEIVIAQLEGKPVKNQVVFEGELLVRETT